MQNEKKHVTFSMRKDVITKLEEYCRKERRTKSAAIELALELLFANSNEEVHKHGKSKDNSNL